MLNLTEQLTTPAPHDEVLRLSFEARQKSRQRVSLESGREAALFMPRGTVLQPGDLLRSEDGTTTVLVAAEPELLSIVHCTDPLILARLCYHLGNRHVALQIEPGRLCYQHDHVLDAMVANLGLHAETGREPFTPEAGAYASTSAGSHAHAHSHAH